ncbi:hypothetical protein HDU76_011639, partial [Blyttiomyces sp. JEL0837]
MAPALGHGLAIRAVNSYIPTGWFTLDTGCLLDAVNGAPRTFRYLINGTATVDSCLALAVTKGYKYAGLEYGGECWADSAFQNTTNVDAPSTDCTFTCNLNSTQICGAGSRLSAFYYNPT